MAGYLNYSDGLDGIRSLPALLALVGTMLMTALLLWAFVSNVVNVLRGGVFHRAQR